MEDFEKTTYSAVTGIAGTGKSFLLKKAAEENSTYTLCSTTGISAVNLGAGTTIHSLLWYFNHPSLLDSFTTGKLDHRLGQIYNKLGVRRILCDEISMMSSQDFSILCLAIENLNHTLEGKGKQQLGFTVSGDFLQLPPIEGGFAFESEHWKKFEPNTTLLTKVYRQTDPKFIQALQMVRRGEGKIAADYFHDIMYPMADPRFEGTSLYPYNSNVDRQNQYRLEKVSGIAISFKSEKRDRQRAEWKYIPAELVLKSGALVMILANHYEKGELEYSNGDLGTIVGATKDSALVRLKRNEKVMAIKHITRFNEEVKDNKKSVVGSIRYVPIRLAYATSVHKSQSLTLDNVQVDIRARFYRECAGMLYVALSRCRSKEGLRIVGSPKTFVRNCVSNPKVEKFL